MDYKKLILNKLLDKYETSKSAITESNRRIILKKEEIKEYDIENYESKNLFHDIVFELNKNELIDYSWKDHEKRKYLKRDMVK